MTACSKPNEKTVESVPVSSTVPEAVEIPVSEPVSAKSKNEEAADQALSEYKKDKEDRKYKKYADEIQSPFFKVYPDIGNLSAWGNDIKNEIKLGINEIVAIHLKDTLAVTDNFPGKFKEVPFGEGCVNFEKFFEVLEELKYKGPFLVEMWTEKAEDPIMEINKANNWIKEKMKLGGFLC